jgi:ABC-type antimicrobial peptide transport system permease subunit
LFYLSYMLSELRRRRGRTILTALGLAVGVGLVVTVNALSTGLDRAQEKVLAPLTGVGTDLSVSRPIAVSNGNNGSGPFAGLSPKERAQLQEENGDARVGLQNLKPGERFSRDTFAATSQLSFPASEVSDVSRIEGVSAAAGGLTLSALHIEGTVPKNAGQEQQGFGQAPVPTQGPRNIGLWPVTVSGVDQSHPELGAITSGQVTNGRYFSTSDTTREAIVTKNLTSKIGTALGIVGLLAAFLIACLLTLSSVAGRIRELGTLKALGWRQRQVVRQVAGESVLQGMLGGLLGIALGIGGALLVGVLAPTLEATVAQAATQTFQPFGQGAVPSESTSVQLDAPVSIGLLAAAVALAVLGRLLSGVVGGLRAARLRPADALRHID